MLNNLNKGQKMTAEKTLKTQIEKTVKTIAKYTEYLKDSNCTDIGIFKAVLNSKLWDLVTYQQKNFDFHHLLKNKYYKKAEGKKSV